MKKNTLNALYLSILASLGATPFANASVTFDQTGRGYSFILNVKEPANNECVTNDERRGLEITHCAGYGDIYLSKRQIFIYTRDH